MIVLAIILSLIVYAYTKKIGTVVNPLVKFLMWDFLLYSMIPLVFAEMIGDETGKISKIILYYVVFYFFGYGSAIFFFDCKIYKHHIESARYVVRLKNYKFIIVSLAVFIFIFYICLMLQGGGGLMWIKNPRAAYIEYRAGVGFFWLLIQWISIILFTFIIYKNRPSSIMSLVVTSLPFMILGYFSGSKANILSFIVISIVYWNFNVAKISIVNITLISLFLLSLFAIVLGFQSVGFEQLGFNVSNYFSENFFVSMKYLNDEFYDPGYGVFLLSDLWYYVPRAIFPDKPYEYGVLMVHKVLFPGAAEQGNTPGTYEWLIFYLDFALLGVIIYGFGKGVWHSLLFKTYLNNKSSPVIFLLFIQFCIFQVLALLNFFAMVFIFIFMWMLRKFIFRNVFNDFAKK